MLKGIVTVGVWTLASRILGFGRDMLIAALAGTGPIADAFFVALKLPNLFRRLFGEGAFNAAFVPAFAGLLQSEGRAAAHRFAEEAFAVMTFWLGLMTVAGEVFMPQLMVVLAPGFTSDPAKFALVVDLSRITFPYLILICLAALVSGVLNGLDRFTAASASYVLFNIVSIACMLWLTPFVPTVGHALSWGVTHLAASCNCGLLMAALRRSRHGAALAPPEAHAAHAPAAAPHGAGPGRRRRDATQPRRRRHHRQPAAPGHRLGPVLRRPGPTTAAGRHRHRRRHRAAARSCPARCGAERPASR